MIISLITDCAYTKPFKNSNGTNIYESIASLEKISLGGVEQWILIRGKNIDNPVLLFLHGGPWMSEMPIVHNFCSKLEENFIFVYWEQRGNGKSYSKNIPEESMTIDQFIEDTHELSQILIKRFNKKKIYVMGLSWGSALGLLTVKRYSESFYAFVGLGQLVDWQESLKKSYQFTLDVARRNGNMKAIRDLEEIGYPPYKEIKDFETQRKWLLKSGGTFYGKTKYRDFISYLKSGLASPEYNFFDYFRLLFGYRFTITNMYKEISYINLFDKITHLEVPVYFLHGRNDYNQSLEVVNSFYEKLEAPKKELIVFENSAHSLHYDENDRFVDVLVSKVLKETYNIN